MMTGAAVVGIDCGTTAVKVVIVDVEEGNLLGEARRFYPSAVPFQGAHEQDPEQWWQATREALAEAVRAMGRPEAVTAIGLSGHMHGLVLIGADDRAVRPAMTWADRRSTPQVAQLRAQQDLFSSRTANPVVEAFTAPKLAWVAQHEPASLAAAQRVVLVKDLIRHRLVGTWGTDRTDAWGTLLFDVYQQRFDPELFALCGAGAHLAPEVAGSSEVVGTLLPDVADAIGLRHDVRVVAGASDVSSSALGTGITDPGAAMINLGTAAQILVQDAAVGEQPWFTFAAADDRSSLSMGSVYAAGLALDWFAEAVAGAQGGSSLDALAASASATDHRPLFVPHLLGTSAPSHDASVGGALLGVRQQHGTAELARSALEGVAFAATHVLLEVAGERALSVVNIGGGPTRSAILAEAIAAVLPTPVHRATRDASPIGAAILAAVGVGVGDLRTVTDRFVELIEVDAPVDEVREELGRAFEVWRRAEATVLEAARGVVLDHLG